MEDIGLREVSSSENCLSLEPPDGGLYAWLSVVAGFFVIMNTWGLVISFGVFQSYYISTLNRSSSDISWIGSLNVFLLFFSGIASGRLTDAGHFHAVSNLGASLIILGTFMASICTQYWQLMLAQGICIGLGNGCLLTPTMAVIATYFKRRLPLVLGLAACGSVTGGLIYPGMARTLLPSVGFGWTMRSIGFVEAGTLAVAMLCIRTRIPPAKPRVFIDWTAFRESEFSLYTLGAFLSFLGVFVPFFFLTSFAKETLGLSYTKSLDLILVLNGIGFVARVFPGVLAKYIGTLNTFIILVFSSSVCLYTWIAVHSIGGLYAWVTFYSLAIGGVQALFPAAVSSLTSDLSQLGSRMGLIFAAVGIGALIGSPISGVIISSSGSYVGAQAFAGSALLLGGIFISAAREIRRRKLGKELFTKL
ncbi:riboflavin transporter MCH5 [Colletotrichum truncatum]|uniref:Riboflavin transporter MCH5 n=1 Tax=Colletotrichum truncatum TaxID=5467 RepID=A0ACC3ZF13_COLTU|nr:riboflavin transporter MCH5 [Colletotrichum truncatum]KAF6801611.1 riboflavin transporter MCH5 [Colletotrichum truncatum]